MKVIPKNYNKKTGYYDALAIISDDSKGTENNPFTDKDINKAIEMAQLEGFVGKSLTNIFVGGNEGQIPDDLPVITDTCMRIERKGNDGLIFISD